MNDTQFLKQAVATAGQFGRVIQLLIDGVAFRENGVQYRIFSHEGDELGLISTADVNFATNFMRRLGRKVGKCHGFPLHEPAFTFAWQGWHPLGC